MNAAAVVEQWVRRFNDGDVDGLAALYAPDAVNHPVVMEPLHGRAAIRQMFATEFGRAEMVCLVENLFDCGEWAVLEWRDRRQDVEKRAFARFSIERRKQSLRTFSESRPLAQSTLVRSLSGSLRQAVPAGDCAGAASSTCAAV